MDRRMTSYDVFRQVVIILGMLAILIAISGCSTTIPTGDAGCFSYAEARLDMPRDVTLPDGPWGDWVVDTDDRMTGTC